VVVQGVTVIPVGSPAMGEITDVRNKGMWGKSGHLGARVLYVTVNGRQIRLSGAFDDKGVTGTAGVVAALALVPVAGFFMTGTSAVVPMGANVKGFVDEDVTLSIAAAPQAPLAVAAPAQPLVTGSQPTTVQK
jgi:phage tail sheath gpL-like